MINDLKKMIKTLQATVDAANKREEALTQERDNLKEEIDLLRKKLFGTSSEKRTLDIPGQLNFFNEAELNRIRRLQKQRILKHSFRKEQPKNENQELQMRKRFKGVPVEKKYLELSEEEKLCSVLWYPAKEIGEEFVRRELVFVPAKLKVYEYYSKSYECPQCRLQDIPVIKKGKRWQSSYALWNGFCRNGCLGDVPEVFGMAFHTIVRKKTGNSMGGDHQSYYGKLGDPKF